LSQMRGEIRPGAHLHLQEEKIEYIDLTDRSVHSALIHASQETGVSGWSYYGDAWCVFLKSRLYS